MEERGEKKKHIQCYFFKLNIIAMICYLYIETIILEFLLTYIKEQ